MPVPYGFTKKAELEAFIKRNPGTYKTGELASQFAMTSSAVSAAMREFMLNFPRYINQGEGRGVWIVDFSEWQERMERERQERPSRRSKRSAGPAAGVSERPESARLTSSDASPFVVLYFPPGLADEKFSFLIADDLWISIEPERDLAYPVLLGRTQLSVGELLRLIGAGMYARTLLRYPLATETVRLPFSDQGTAITVQPAQGEAGARAKVAGVEIGDAELELLLNGLSLAGEIMKDIPAARQRFGGFAVRS